MALVTLARHAMATRFEIVLHGSDPVKFRAAAEEALDEIGRLEGRLSLFRPTSEISRLNAGAARQPIRVTPELFALLQQAQKLHRESGGVFDITIAPVVRCWGFMHGTGCVPTAEALSEARACVGMGLVHLNAKEYTVEFGRQGVMLDLGAIGKGYAGERAAGLLREAGVGSALLHGGTSTIYALGHPPEAGDWKVAIADPRNRPDTWTTSGTQAAPKQALEVPPLTGEKSHDKDEARNSLPFATVGLKDESLSVSAVWGKCFREQGKTFGHILDPRTGLPAAAALLSAVVLPSATETDALSTALLTVGPEGHEEIARLRPGMRTLVVGEFVGQLVTRAKGIRV